MRTTSTGSPSAWSIARALMGQPRVLLVDEPTAALDKESTLAFEGLLRREMEKGTGILWVTHSGEQAERIGHRRLTLGNGTLPRE